jgi:hypothetical protein
MVSLLIMVIAVIAPHFLIYSCGLCVWFMHFGHIYNDCLSPLNRDADRAIARDTIARDTTARDISKAEARDTQVGMQIDI